MRIKSFSIALACAAALGSAHANTNLVINGGFEQTTNGLGQFDNNTHATGWTSTGYNFLFDSATVATSGTQGKYGKVALWGPAYGSNNGITGSPTGGNFVGADGAFEVGAITQTVTGLVVGQTYELSFDWAAAQQARFYGDTTSQWQINLGGTSFATAVYHLPNMGFSGWMHETYTYTASTTSAVLSFLSRGTPTGLPPFALLDSVSLTAMPSAVPEPAVSALMLGSLGVVGAAARRRQRKQA